MWVWLSVRWGAKKGGKCESQTWSRRIPTHGDLCIVRERRATICPSYVLTLRRKVQKVGTTSTSSSNFKLCLSVMIIERKIKQKPRRKITKIVLYNVEESVFLCSGKITDSYQLLLGLFNCHFLHCCVIIWRDRRWPARWRTAIIMNMIFSFCSQSSPPSLDDNELLKSATNLIFSLAVWLN